MVALGSPTFIVNLSVTVYCVVTAGHLYLKLCDRPLSVEESRRENENKILLSKGTIDCHSAAAGSLRQLN